MKIKEVDIRSAAPGRIFKRGVQYHLAGRVELVQVQPDYVKATVSGTTNYTVELRQDDKGYVYGGCTCPYWATCKHVVATMLTAREYYKKNGRTAQARASGATWKAYVDHIRRYQPARKAPPRWRLIFILDLRDDEFAIHPQKAMLRKDGNQGALRNLGYGDSTNPEIDRGPRDSMGLRFLEMAQTPRYYAYGYPLGTYVFKYGESIGTLFELLHESQICLRHDRHKSYPGTPIEFSQDHAGVEFRLSREGERVAFKPYLRFPAGAERPLNSDYRILTSEPIWVIHDHTLFKVEGITNATPLLPFTRSGYEVVIPEAEVGQFLEAIAQDDWAARVRLPEGARTETVDEISEKRLYLEETPEGLSIKLKFCYLNVEVDLDDPRQSFWSSRPEENVFCRIVRSQEQEAEALQQLLATRVKRERYKGIVTRKNQGLKWLMEDLPDLAAGGFVIFGEEKLKEYKVNRAPAQVRVAVQSDIDWFDLQMEIDFGGIALSLKELRKALKQKSRYVKLADGSFATLPKAWLNRFKHALNFSEETEHGLRVSAYHVTLIDELFAEAQHKRVDRGYKERLQLLRNFTGIEGVPSPDTFQGTLRPYQQAGLNWLHFLNKYNFGGCLADDMGLGKTIQALALLLAVKQNGSAGPALIVAPTSVVFNWLQEIERFAPHMRVVNLTGTDRPRTRKHYDDCDIVLTTYGTLRRDIVFLKDVQFDYVILDESQNIKNPLSQTAKAAKLLNAKHRLALTGTPVENNTIELWSLFAFLNPGLLGNLNYFKGAFAKPIEQNRDRETAELLRKIVFPFILRRTKEEVEKDLPPKVENTIFCEMSPQQEKLYNQWRDYYRAALLKRIAEVGLDKARMNVLEGLTKLRQIACHPLLIQEQFRGKVGKYETFIEHLEELLAEGHKVLVFSQFVKMLTIIRRFLDSRRVTYEYLDGKTRDRKACVERFQKDDACKIFLISLRAGGTGLNLTAADYVIHYDPWWNPAVEAQATDRTHRIGQDKHVFVYKMITKDSVEEKIVQLQARKRELVSNLITTDAGLFKHLTVEDIEGLFS